jgi:hypothetical protein
MVVEEKFTLPLISYIIDDLKLCNHRFLILDNKNICEISSNNIVTLSHPIRKYFVINFFKFINEVFLADKIIVHAAPLSYFFILVPWKLKNVIWAIHGGIDIPDINNSKGILPKIDTIYKRKIGFHTSHIEEDSIYVNEILSSKAKFIYSPMYLSNVVNILKDENDFLYNKKSKNNIVLLGNSTSPYNNHLDAFNKLFLSDLSVKFVFSFLSYGKYNDYKNDVIKKGFEIFGNKFTPITEFLELNQFLELLNKIDLAILNHERQEAMGLTIQLLSLGKPIFFNSESPAYKSFKRRGYLVFSLNELDSFKDIKSLDLRGNRKLLLKEYSKDVLNSFYNNL